MRKPKYKHDCDLCMFLGSHEFKNSKLVNDGIHDIYACNKSMPTIIVRFGNDGSDYFTGLSYWLDAMDSYYSEKENEK